MFDFLALSSGLIATAAGVAIGAVTLDVLLVVLRRAIEKTRSRQRRPFSAVLRERRAQKRVVPFGSESTGVIESKRLASSN